MLLTAPVPFDAAIRRLESKTPVVADLSSAEWQQLNIGLLDRSFFSARVTEIQTLASMYSKIDDALKLEGNGAFMDRSRFIAEMRSELGASPGDSDSLTDLTSAKRLGLVYDFNTEDAQEYGRWKARQDPDLLDAFPCNELVRVEDRDVPRGYRRGAKGRLIQVPGESWPSRWAAAGGLFFDGRMIAPKGDPVWTKISRFGRPWPPFDFNSGMGLVDIERDEAESLGVIAPGAPAPEPEHMDFNHKLESSVPKATPALLDGFKQVFGDQVDVDRQGNITWLGSRLAATYERALADKTFKTALNLGSATPEAIALADEVGEDLTDAKFFLTADDIRHINTEHGIEEDNQANRPVTSLDIQLLPHVWRSPDSVEAGSVPGTLIFKKDILGRSALVTWNRNHKTEERWGVKTFWLKKKKGTP